MSKTTLVGLRLDNQIVKFLKARAISDSRSGENKSIEYTQLIRQAILSTYGQDIKNFIMFKNVFQFSDAFDNLPFAITLKEDEKIKDLVSNDAGRSVLLRLINTETINFVTNNSIVRKVLLTDNLPWNGEFPRYDADTYSWAYINSQDIEKVILDENIEISSPPEILLPLFEILSSCKIKVSKMFLSQENVLKEISKEVKESATSLVIQEEIGMFRLMQKASQVASFEDMKCILDGSIKNETVKNVITNGETYNKLSTMIYGKNFVNPYKTDKNTRMIDGIKDINNVNFRIVNTCPRNIIFTTPVEDDTGVMVIKGDLITLPYDKPKTLQMGWITYHEVGMMVSTEAIKMIQI